MSFVEIPVTLVAEAIVKVLRRVKVAIEFDHGTPRVSLSYQAAPSLRDADKRLAKIEVAREGLQEALGAMDELKQAAEENRRDLERINEAIAKAETDKAGLHAQVEALQQIAALDGTAVREALKIPGEIDKWKERIWGFLFGLLAAAIVTLAWELGLKPYLEHRHQSQQPTVTMPK